MALNKRTVKKLLNVALVVALCLGILLPSCYQYVIL